MPRAAIPALVLALSLSAAAVAQPVHGGHGGGHDIAASIGQPGDPSAVARTIEITMHDNYFEPETISVSAGETVRFVVRNAGAFVHEFNIATAEMHEKRRPEMKMLVEHGVLRPDRVDHEAAARMTATMGHGLHGAGNSVLIGPGGSQDLVWTFAHGRTLEFACNVPGHYDAGMTGEIKVGH